MRLDFLGPAEGPAPSWGGLRALRPRAPCPGPTCLLGVAAGHWVEQEGRGHSGGQVQGRLLASELPRSAGFQVTCRPSPQPLPTPAQTQGLRFRPLARGPQGPCWVRAPPACTEPGQRPPKGPRASQCPRSPAQPSGAQGRSPAGCCPGAQGRGQRLRLQADLGDRPALHSGSHQPPGFLSPRCFTLPSQNR